MVLPSPSDESEYSLDTGSAVLRLESDGESDSSELDSASDDDEVSESEDDVSSEPVDPASVLRSVIGSLNQSPFRYGIFCFSYAYCRYVSCLTLDCSGDIGTGVTFLEGIGFFHSVCHQVSVVLGTASC